MVSSVPDSSPSRGARWFVVGLVLLSFAFSAWTTTVGWESKMLPGVEFRQTQTALSALFIKKENNFSLAYPTPVLGKPWSVPMEFPLYQWTVVVTGKLTGWGLTKAGRAVSIACFYLSLPAVWLLLGWWGVAPWRRGLVLALFLTSPLLLFYGRAFLIETMALMFSLWFCVAYLRAVRDRSVAWLALAAAMGTGAGLVKITTLLLHLLPLIAWSVVRLWRERARWRSEVLWMAAAVVVPAAATWWWTGRADAIKQLNPQAHFLLSDNLRGFNLGTERTRFSAEMWRLKVRILTEELTYWPAVAAVALLGLCAGWRRGLAALGCLAVFAAALEIFPELYAYHDYYYVANIAWLLLAVGFVIVGLAERARFGFAALVAATFVATQAGMFVRHYYPIQSVVADGSTGLSIAMQSGTHADEVIVVTGQDWDSSTAYFAQRRALMLRIAVRQQPEQVRRALDALAGERIGALAVADDGPDSRFLIEEAAKRGIDPVPVLRWRRFTVYFRRDQMDWALRELMSRLYGEVQLLGGRQWPVNDAEAAASRELIADRWIDARQLPKPFVNLFEGMSPHPVRLFARFGTMVERTGGHLDFSAHPDTRLVFSLPAGLHVLRTKVFFAPGAFDPALAPEAKSDGVQVVLRELGSGKVFFSHLIDPVKYPSHRNRVGLNIPFELAQPAEVELWAGPGPAANYARDWFWFDRLTIE